MLFLSLLFTMGSAGCGGSVTGDGTVYNPPLRHDDATETCCAGLVYKARTTGYYPANDPMQGGFLDRRGKKLRTLEDFVDGKVDYVSVAMDSNTLKYGAKVCIPKLNTKYGKAIPFRIVDTGGAFRLKGTSRLDICTRDKKSAHSKHVNQTLEIVVCD